MYAGEIVRLSQLNRNIHTIYSASLLHYLCLLQYHDVRATVVDKEVKLVVDASIDMREIDDL